MPFVSSVVPPSKQGEPAWWFVFKDDAVLVKLNEDVAHIPCVTALDQLSLQPIRTQYLGTLDGRHCYSAEVDAQDNSIPDGMSFQRFRSLYNALPEEIFWAAGRAFQVMDWDRTHQYCGKCGHPTQSAEGERAKVCPECGQTSYPRIAPAVIVAVVKDRQLLLAHANRFPKGLYSVIAGFVEVGETFEECVRREVKEETAIEVKDIQYFGSQPWPFPHSLMVGFTAKYAGGEIRVDDTEITEAGWFTADNLPICPTKISIARRLIDWFVENTQNSKQE
jgi:NAD+ diphosphatase